MKIVFNFLITIIITFNLMTIGVEAVSADLVQSNGSITFIDADEFDDNDLTVGNSEVDGGAENSDNTKKKYESIQKTLPNTGEKLNKLTASIGYLIIVISLCYLGNTKFKIKKFK